MIRRKLGRTGLDVSALCLGTMTWGSQNSESEAHDQIEMAVDAGIDIIDTAEMYPTTPRKAETTGLTESILGSWLAKPSNREKVIVATKIVGEGVKDMRGGMRVTGAMIRQALEDSLKRLRTDHIDLYQLHWPNRGSYHFRKNWTYDAAGLEVGDMDQEVADMLGAVADLQGEGKLGHFGLSNESAWGVMKFLEQSDRHGLPRVASIQNEYSLLCRHFDLDLAEIAAREDVGLLAFSPLAAGLLSGKYIGGDVPEGSRMSMQPKLNGRNNPVSREAVTAYHEVAEKHGLALNQMALAFCTGRPFMTSAIIGATDLVQLKSNLDAAALVLSEAVLEDIGEVRRRYPMPM